MSDNNFLEYNLPQNAYASFDAVTLKQLIVDQLNTNSIFKDQNFEGSNLNSLIDIVAVSYHVLLFYLNQTSSETTFSQATLYENMNKIVNLVGYKPVGRQTSIVNVNMTGNSSLPISIYTIPRFANVSVNGISYVLIDDVTFEKTLASDEQLSTNNNFMYQGTLTEYPTYTAAGEDFETVFISYENFVDTSDERFVADNTFRVFIKEAFTGLWYQWVETSNLFDESGTTRVYEKRLNEYGRFELRFGNDVNGKKLQTNDLVGVYFIYSDGSKGVVGENIINTGLKPFVSNRYNEIILDLYSNVKLITNNELKFITTTNPNKSSEVTVEETVDQIKLNAPKFVNSQNRAVTVQDYNLYLRRGSGSYIASSSVLDNSEYTDKYLKYFYNIGLKSPNTDTNLLINQVDFMTSTNFNNVYVFMVPKIGSVNSNNTPIFLSQSQKQLILNELDKVKVISQQIVPMDAVYQSFDFGVLAPNETLNLDIIGETNLIIVRSKNSKQNREKIKNEVVTILTNYFSSEQTSIGQLVDLTTISSSILSINGVTNFYTQRTTSNGETYNTNYLSFVYWNPLYPTQDINITAQAVQLDKFKYPYLNNVNNLFTKISVIDE